LAQKQEEKSLPGSAIKGLNRLNPVESDHCDDPGRQTSFAVEPGYVILRGMSQKLRIGSA
jgi:hypothetical protein